ncbi:MAG: hypothetical protein E3J56_07285, partial [Candidatus Aminicenantes bacterium]
MVSKKCLKAVMGVSAALIIMVGIVSSTFAVEVNVPKGFKFGTYTQQPWAGKTIHVAMVAEPRCDA